MRESLELRIEKKIDRVTESGCWIFTGAVNHFGYGMVGLGGRKDGIDRVHRIMYRKHFGAIPDGMYVCHRCDVPSCCNPSHLFLGTSKDNNRDMELKKRNSPPPRNIHDKGEYRYNSKLTEEIVLKGRAMVLSGDSISSVIRYISKITGASSGPIYRALKGRSWRHV